MKTGNLKNQGNLAYVTINGNLPDQDGNFSGIATGENFTTEEKNKLSTLEPPRFIGIFKTVEELNAITGVEGQYAYVDLGTENQISVYLWDNSDGMWVSQLVTSATPSAGEIATLYESNPDVERFTTVDKNKLDTLENFNPSTLDNTFNQKVDKVEGKVLSTNDFTTSEREKLAGLEGPKFKGEFTSLESLKAIVGSTGEYAYVDLGAGSTVEKYIWDTTDEDWIMQQGESNLITPAQIKSDLLTNENTNIVTDEELVNIQLIPTKQDISSENTLTSAECEAGVSLMDNTDYLVSESVSILNITSAVGSLSLQFTCGDNLEITLPENTGWGISILPIYTTGKIYTMIFFRNTWYIDEGR